MATAPSNACKTPGCSRERMTYRSYCAIHFCNLFGVEGVEVSAGLPFTSNKPNAAQILSNGLRRMRDGTPAERNVSNFVGILNHVSTVLCLYDDRLKETKSGEDPVEEKEVSGETEIEDMPRSEENALFAEEEGEEEVKTSPPAITRIATLEEEVMAMPHSLVMPVIQEDSSDSDIFDDADNCDDSSMPVQVPVENVKHRRDETIDMTLLPPPPAPPPGDDLEDSPNPSPRPAEGQLKKVLPPSLPPSVSASRAKQQGQVIHHKHMSSQVPSHVVIGLIRDPSSLKSADYQNLTEKHKSSMLMDCVGLFEHLKPFTCNCDEALSKPSHIGGEASRVCPVFIVRVFWTSHALRDVMMEVLGSDNTLLVSNAIKFVWGMFDLFHRLPLCTRYSALRCVGNGNIDVFVNYLHVMSPQPWAGNTRYLHPILFDTCLQLVTGQVTLKPICTNFLPNSADSPQFQDKNNIISVAAYQRQYRKALRLDVDVREGKSRRGRKIDLDGKFSVDLFVADIKNPCLLPHMLNVLQQSPGNFLKYCMKNVYSMLLNKKNDVPPVEIVVSQDNWVMPIFGIMKHIPYRVLTEQVLSLREMHAAHEASKYCQRFLREAVEHVWMEQDNNFKCGILMCDIMQQLMNFGGGWTRSTTRVARDILTGIMKKFHNTSYGVRLKSTDPGSHIWDHTMQLISVALQFVLFTGFSSDEQEVYNPNQKRNLQTPKRRSAASKRNSVPLNHLVRSQVKASDQPIEAVTEELDLDMLDRMTAHRSRATFASVSKLGEVLYYLDENKHMVVNEETREFWENTLSGSVVLHCSLTGSEDGPQGIPNPDGSVPEFVVDDLELLDEIEEVLSVMRLKSFEPSTMPNLSSFEKNKFKEGHKLYVFVQQLRALMNQHTTHAIDLGWTVAGKQWKEEKTDVRSSSMKKHQQGKLSLGAEPPIPIKSSSTSDVKEDDDLQKFLEQEEEAGRRKLAFQKMNSFIAEVDKFVQSNKKVLRKLFELFPYVHPCVLASKDSNRDDNVDVEQIVTEGCLYKLLGEEGQWKPYWFRLTPNSLSYQVAGPDGTLPRSRYTTWRPAGQLLLKDIAAIRRVVPSDDEPQSRSTSSSSNNGMEEAKRNNMFVVDSPAESFVVLALDGKKCSRWLHFLEMIIRNTRLKHGTPRGTHALAQTLKRWSGSVVWDTTPQQISSAVKGLAPVFRNMKEVEKCENSEYAAKPCNTKFGLLDKKNHCGSCGHVFCKSCLNNTITISRMDDMPATPIRICIRCMKLSRATNHTRAVILAKLLKPSPTDQAAPSLGKRSLVVDGRRVVVKDPMAPPSTQTSPPEQAMSLQLPKKIAAPNTE